MKILFMGTPEFAVVQLDALFSAGHEIVCVITQPDKPKGRGGELSSPPVKIWALDKGINVKQPASLRDNAIMPLLEEYNPDAAVVAAYGKILPQYALGFAKYGCINVHASLLPKYRGAAPANWAIINGESESGVTIMRMDAGIDTGDIITRKAVPIPKGCDSGKLLGVLAALGSELLTETLRRVEDGTAEFIRQDSLDAEPSYAPKIDNAFCRLDFTLPAIALEHKIYGLAPVPGAFARLDGRLIKIFSAETGNGHGERTEPGSIIYNGSGISVVCGEGTLRLLEVQPEGGRRMGAGEFVRGKYRDVSALSGKKFE